MRLPVVFAGDGAFVLQGNAPDIGCRGQRTRAASTVRMECASCGRVRVQRWMDGPTRGRPSVRGPVSGVCCLRRGPKPDRVSGRERVFRPRACVFKREFTFRRSMARSNHGNGDYLNAVLIEWRARPVFRPGAFECDDVAGCATAEGGLQGVTAGCRWMLMLMRNWW
jgi:hypothetical protein